MLDYLCAADNSDSNRFARINGPYRTDTERAAIAQLFSLELSFFFLMLVFLVESIMSFRRTSF